MNFYSNFNLNTSTTFKDLYLLNNDNDLLNKDNLNLLYWLTSNSSKNNNLIFFNYLNFLYTNKTTFSFFYKKNEDLMNLNFWLVYSLINVDKFYINDALYLSLFN